MKSSLMAVAIFLSSSVVQAQLKSSRLCLPFHIDIVDGSVSKMYPQSPFGDIMKQLPCYTDAVEEMSSNGCGGVYFKDKGVFFHTYRQYIEIKENFNGTISIPLMGANRNHLTKWLGNPVTRDIMWEVYQMRYGSLVLFFNPDGNVNNIVITTKNAESLKMCE